MYSFLAILGLPCCAQAFPSRVRASRCSGLSCCRAWARGCICFSSCGSQTLERRFNSCGSGTWLLYGMWDPPGSGIQPVSPALAGRLSPTESQGSPKLISFFKMYLRLRQGLATEWGLLQRKWDGATLCHSALCLSSRWPRPLQRAGCRAQGPQ